MESNRTRTRSIPKEDREGEASASEAYVESEPSSRVEGRRGSERDGNEGSGSFRKSRELLLRSLDACRDALGIGNDTDGTYEGNVLVVWDERMLDHKPEPGEFHFERPARVSSILEMLEKEDLLPRLVRVPSRIATDRELRSCHDEEHVRRVEESYAELRAEGDTGWEDPDMYWSEGTALAARLGAGSLLEITKQVLSGEDKRAFAVIRPPGHHACQCKIMGFCFYNNVAIAAREAIESGEAKRVVILDWDVHHGNGTQEITEEDPNILYISLHRYENGFYPETGWVDEVGKEDGKGFNVNVPFQEEGMAGIDYLTAMHLVVLPICLSFNPDLVIISSGFDAANGDPLGGMKLLPDDYGLMTQMMMTLAAGRIVVALEGGYNLANCANCSQAIIEALLNEREFRWKPSNLRSSTESTIRRVLKEQSEYWSVLKDAKFVQLVDEYFTSVRRRKPRRSASEQLLEEAQLLCGRTEFPLQRRTRGSPAHVRAVVGQESKEHLVRLEEDLEYKIEVTLRETSDHLEEVTASINALQLDLALPTEDSEADALHECSNSSCTSCSNAHQDVHEPHQ